MTKLLWVSKDQMTDEQKSAIYKIYGDDTEIKTVPLIGRKSQNSKVIAEQIMSEAHDCEVIAGDFSTSILEKLVNPKINYYRKIVIRPLYRRISTGWKYAPFDGVEGVSDFQEQHEVWQKIVGITVVAESLAA